MPRPRALLLLCLAIPLSLSFLALQDKTAPWRRPGNHLGNGKCVECHEDEANAIEGGHHRPVVHNQLLKSCETCHGPGEAHARHEDNDPALITHPEKLAAAAQKELCASCHREQTERHGGDPEGFLKAGKGCTDCHDVHAKITAPAHKGVRFASRAAAESAAKTIGSKECISCHPLRDQLLAESHHPRLVAARSPEGCERCHGPGSLHAATHGLRRLITRPDRAVDGAQTCTSCHENVDPVAFHWKDRRKPLLGEDVTCTTCHTIHESKSLPADKLPAAPGVEPAPASEPTNAMCVKCHAPAFAAILQRPEDALAQARVRAHTALGGTIHASLALPSLPLEQGCGSCHANAYAHARASGKRGLVDSLRGASAAKQLTTCGKCHDGDRHLVHVRAGSHFRNDVGCTACHDVGSRPGHVAKDAQQQCTQCHQDVAAQFQQPNRHPVPEGHMACIDCHEPHGARRKIRDKELKEDRCVGCHKQYAGPFVFAHQVSRQDGCVACHLPHGSPNRRMLQQPRTQQNCLQCHGDFPAFHDQTPGAVFTNCLNCHTQVHGSNHSRYLFR